VPEPVGVIGEELVRRAVAAFVTDALQPSHCRAVVRELLNQLRDLAACLPDPLPFRLSLWIDHLAAVADTPTVGAEISARCLAVVSPLLRAGAGAVGPPTMGGELVEELRELD
jgi:hypothetical protein